MKIIAFSDWLNDIHHLPYLAPPLIKVARFESYFIDIYFYLYKRKKVFLLNLLNFSLTE